MDNYYLNEINEAAEAGASSALGMYKVVALILSVLAFIFAGSFAITLVLYVTGTTVELEPPTAFVYDVDGADWSDSDSIPVFYNEEFGSAKVAPYSSGSYTFVFTNGSDHTLSYSVVLGEQNEYDIAMCYKLKRDGAYVVSDYYRAGDFSCTGLTIESGSKHSFELEWYWDGDVNDYNDTLAGSTASIYTLTITVSAMSA